MNRYFYTIEEEMNGDKAIHLLGNLYNSDDHYSLAEWSFYYLNIIQAQSWIRSGEFNNSTNVNVKYEDSFSEEIALDLCDCYFDGKSGTYLHIADITPNTSCGDYYFDLE